jgi:serine/threonine protein phosphatase 1
MIHPMATHVIGDVHGCYRELCELLERLAPAAEDRLIFVGDLVVRGPENARVVRMFLDGELADATVLLGNNEEKLPPAIAPGAVDTPPAVQHAVDQLRDAGLLEAALALFASFPLYVDLGALAVVHAGVRPGVPLEAQSRDDLLKIKTLDGTPDGRMWWEDYEGPKRIVFGHHVVRDPFVRPYAVGLDTGCVYGGSLTALTLETGAFTRVRAAETYYRHPGKWHLFV